MYTNKILIIDFEDSFTFNIASDLSIYFSNIEVINYRDFNSSKIDFLKSNNEIFSIVLGPGPGHPNDYIQVKNIIKDELKNLNVFIYGICLGHQIIASLLGLEIVQAKLIVHGDTELVNYRGQEYVVQRYNSLVPKTKSIRQELLVVKEEVLIISDINIFSVQFHPESIGTNKGHDFYQPLIKYFKK